MKKRVHDSDEETTAKRIKLDPSIVVEKYFSKEYLKPASEELQKSYSESQPFRHLALENFSNEEFLMGTTCQFETLNKPEITEALQDELWFPKNNDLYTFEQTDDLKCSPHPTIKTLCSALYSKEFRSFLESLTGIQLSDKVDISSHIYRKVLYCVTTMNWKAGGLLSSFIWYLRIGRRQMEVKVHSYLYNRLGTLDLFTTDSEFNALDIFKRIVPKRNALLFFETTPASWHQVSEVLSDKLRNSISGWFHGENIVRPPHPKEAPLETESLEEAVEDQDLRLWVNEKYLESDSQEKIKKHFSRNSSIGLNDFLVEAKYQELRESLEEADWRELGPAQRRHYYSLGRSGQENATGVLVEFKKLLKTKAFAQLISSLTGLELQAVIRGEFRKWEKQCYTLVQDCEDQIDSCGIDLLFGFHRDDAEWEADHGGFTTYLDETTELLTLMPHGNLLALVFRDKGCMRFVKFVKSTAPVPRYDFHSTYVPVESESKSGEEESSEEESDSGSGVSLEFHSDPSQ